ncbi:zinc finger matrin-type protein 5-like [Tubulanus polymorphus]|uniref:zinc finger matrin-type protein 5-like n=1 Tax=Tubulanus polymorphus TaxID=672921 RepID=UPI003DA67B28
MGKRYYCEVCDKHFADNVTNRRNHLKGLAHQRNRKAHYDACRDAATILAEEAKKNPCRKFASGQCIFGASCRFSHMTYAYRIALEKQAEADWFAKRRKMEEAAKNESPKFESWLEKFESKSSGSDEKESDSDSLHIPEFSLPEFLHGIPDLPPSLIPPTKEDILTAPFSEWG